MPTSTLQKSEAPLGCSSQLHAPPASHDSTSRVKREGREGRHTRGIPGSQAEKNNSTFWLLWILGTSASIDLLHSLNRGMKAPVRGGKHQRRLFRGCGTSTLRDIQQWTGQGPKQPHLTLKVALLQVGGGRTSL